MNYETLKSPLLKKVNPPDRSVSIVLSTIAMAAAIVYSLVYLIYCIPGIFDLGFLRSEISAFTIMCLYDDNDMCVEGSKISSGPMVFKVDSNNQRVIYYAPDGELDVLKGCVVKDRKNWQCESSPVKQGFINGKYFHTFIPSSAIVSKWEWYTIRKPFW